MRLRKPAPIEPRKSGDAHLRLRSQRMATGVKMKLIGWAIALAAAGLTPAAAQTPATRLRPRQRLLPTRRGDAARRDRAGRDQARRRPAGRSVPGSVGHMIPTPGIGEPDGRKGIQDAGHADRRGAVGFHNNWLLPLCASISVFVLALLLCAMFRFRRGANPTPSRNSHNTLIEVVWTLVPVLILVGDRDPVDPPAAPPIYAAAGRRDGQGHRPPMVLDLRISRLWRVASTATC